MISNEKFGDHFKFIPKSQEKYSNVSRDKEIQYTTTVNSDKVNLSNVVKLLHVPFSCLEKNFGA